MQSITRRRRYLAVVIQALALVLLAGCAPGAKAPPAETVSAPPAAAAPTAPEGPSVARLGGEREGFVITEIPRMDAASRGDFERAVALLEAGDHGGAAELFEQVIARAPHVTAPYVNAAIAYRHLEAPQRAEAHLKEALNLFPNHPAAGNEYALLLRKGGRFDEARTVYEETLAAFPEYQPARRNLGILCDLYLNDPACALAQYEAYSAAMPDDERVGVWIAELRARQGL